ncbi:VPLPA-CTERM sorting domain-containing protein [Geobacter pelophilus]|uniref:VPLPA-CTERM sorting domain-containing protein n=1 Tax=Geoanaerobacter pelophilus TaxID=60036 RepID=A0AAW4L5F2_9BACT|nr:VPLPA-CTERM sorting domain-containing protein [Geoanaerobacter pelophilus]MBT0666133.1 VPLPA-CTERM sorting domain-containing protein [Geoanaerobacter pelophilus]
MKKQIVALIAGAMMTLAAGNAMAYFEDGHLIRVIRDTGSNSEIATDLGAFDVKTLATAPVSLTVGNGANAFTNFASADFSKLFVAYYAVNSANTDLWLSNKSTTPTAASLLGTQWSNVKAGIVPTYIEYAKAGTQTSVLATSNSNGYVSKLNKGTTMIGRYAGAFGTTPASAGEMQLTALATGGLVQTNLYFWDNPGLTGTANTTGNKVAVITTLANGSTVLSGGTAPVATPIPAAAWLLGSGLLGMVGIRRKSNKA